MQQSFHSNAKTNVHIREQIQNSNSKISCESLATQFAISSNTILKWRNRDFLLDASSRPKNIEYALSQEVEALIVSIRSTTWFSIDEVHEMVQIGDSTISRSSISRCLCKHNINKKPEKEKRKIKEFKEYQPGYLHIDVTYLPRLDGHKWYLFVAIDRATRLMYYKVYDSKTATACQDFFDECLFFFPNVIEYILTDNGLEFTNRLIKSKTGNLCTKPSLLDIKCEENNIEHRLTKPGTPQTNGMVERVNGTIKNATILKHNYQNISELNAHLISFLIHYNLYRRHGSLRKELNVKTPFQALEKWYEIKPEIFNITPCQFKNKLLKLHPE